MFVAAVGQAMNKLLVIQAFRPDRLIASAHNFVATVLGTEFMARAEQELDLGSIVENEVGLYTTDLVVHVYHWMILDIEFRFCIFCPVSCP